MNEGDRRETDAKFEFIKEQLNEIKETLTGADGLCKRTAIVETKLDAQAIDIRDHKGNHWQFFLGLIAVAGVAVSIIEMIKK